MTKQLPCREHGGTFTVEARRGRPPVRCSAENPCTEIPTRRARTRSTSRQRVEHAAGREHEADTKAERDAAAIQAAKARATRQADSSEYQRELANAVKAPRKLVAARSDTTPSVSKAHAAKELLEPLGWQCSARLDDRVNDVVGLTATRGVELLVIVWQSGALVSQNYTLWSTMKPSDNGMPKHILPFDPDELSDSELIRAVSGMEVTWWNRIAKSRESAVVSPDKVSITHAYSATGDEVPGDRVITFVDYAGSGFRSFRAGALLKIGK